MTTTTTHITNTRRNPRLIRTEYSGAAGDRLGHATTIDGALRAAILRVARGQYTKAAIYDDRFTAGEPTTVPALTITSAARGLRVTWATTPKWKE